MIKQHKWKLLISSIITLLPALTGEFILPVILLLMNWLCIFITAADPFNKNQNKKVSGLVIWIFPFLSVYISLMFYAVEHGMEFGSEYFTIMLVGAMFIVFGNYLPKCKQNYTIGIKVVWTLNDEENWNKTHRMAGKVWVIGGLLILFTMFLPYKIIPYLLITEMLVICFVPMIYSYLFYRKKKAAGSELNTSTQWQGMNTKYGKISLVIVLLIVIFVLVLMFTGDIDVEYGESAFTVDSLYWKETTLNYSDVEDMEYRSEPVEGSRTNGFGSPRLLMGTFRNEEFNYYTRYTYTNCDASIVLETENRVYVISGSDEASTKAIYDELETRIK